MFVGRPAAAQRCPQKMEVFTVWTTGRGGYESGDVTDDASVYCVDNREGRIRVR